MQMQKKYHEDNDDLDDELKVPCRWKEVVSENLMLKDKVDELQELVRESLRQSFARPRTSSTSASQSWRCEVLQWTMIE